MRTLVFKNRSGKIQWNFSWILIGVVMSLALVSASCRSKKETVKSDTKVSNSKVQIVAERLGVSEKEVRSSKLYSFIGEWYGTPYKYGGCGRDGVDCSCFTGTLFQKVYGKTIARSSSQLWKECDHIKTRNLEEGDLVFFKIGSKDVSHVGVYLKDNKFVHASTKKGVMISSLDEQFFKDTYHGAGRWK